MTPRFGNILSILANLYVLRERTHKRRSQRWQLAGYSLATVFFGASVLFLLLGCHHWLRLEVGLIQAHFIMALALACLTVLMTVCLLLMHRKPPRQDAFNPEKLQEFVESLDDDMVTSIESAIEAHPATAMLLAAGLGAFCSSQLRS